MRRTIAICLLSLLVVPAAASAKPAKISPRAVTVSAAGVASVEVANPNAYALRGKATLAAGGETLATKSVRLAKRSVGRVRLFIGTGGVDAVRAAGGRATLKLKLGRGGTARRALAFQLPGDAAPAPAEQTPAPAPAPASNRWVGRMGTEGDYDDLELTVENGQVQITKTPLVPVYCFENGDDYGTALSYEPFSAPGPWTVGQDGELKTEGIASNQLVGSSTRGITYTVKGLAQDPQHLTGTLGMSFFDSKMDIFTNYIWFVNCSGSQSFEAVPAP